ncbi:hypothetical protein M9Y10_005460 [Tritrichomonas musculus]|uniref:PCI domain-containing protein n=1 Tax=Tritrichomonas musculus TaxID=1915356 RepID=A0ABR2JN94_9EUKA
MSNRNVNVDAKYSQAQRLYATNQHEQALDELCDYFAKPKIKVWDPTLDGMAQLALELSAELSRPVPNVIKRYTQYSIDYALDTLPATITKYVENCYSHIETEKSRAQTEQNNCNSPLLKMVDLPRLLYDSIVRPAVEFMYGVYVTILTELREKTRRYDQLYHEILAKAFRFSAEFNNSEYLRYFSTELFNYYTANGLKKSNIIPFIQSQYVRYETAVKLNNLDVALYALGDATKAIDTDKTISPIIIQKIRKAKYDLLKKNGDKLYAAIIHSNLLELYNNNRNLDPEMPLDRLHEIVLIEALTSPLVQKSSYIYVKPTLKIFLDVVGETIPSREILVKHLLEQPVTPALSDFANAAEFGTDPFVISEKFQKFQEVFNQHDYYQDFKQDLENYAALRAIERACFHYTKIHFDELTDMIPWMGAEEIEEIIVQASRDSVIPGHINQQGNYVELIPRGEQCLQPRLSNLNDKLRDIYDHFQRIKKVLPASLANQVIQSEDSDGKQVHREERVYDSKEKIEERKKLIKERQNQAKRIKEQREREAELRRSERQKQKEEEELKHRELELKNKAERDKNEQEYNFALTEIKILAHRNDINVDEFLNAPPVEGEPEHTGNSKSEDLEWIKFKSEQIKVIHVENKRSQSSIIAEKMNKVKNDRGRERVRQRLAFKLFIEKGPNYKKEPVLIEKLMERQAHSRKKQYEADAAAYEQLKTQCENAKESFEILVYDVNQKFEENRAKAQGSSQLGIRFQTNVVKQPDLPSSVQAQQPSTSAQESSNTVTESVEEKKENEVEPEKEQPTKEQTPSKPKYKPVTQLPVQPQKQQPPPPQQQPAPATPTSSGAYEPKKTFTPSNQKPQNAQSFKAQSTSNTGGSKYKPPTTGISIGGASQGQRGGGDKYQRPRDDRGGNRGRGGRGGGGNRGNYSQNLAAKYGTVPK